eukprot:386218-Pleurochrysis_carterae.AAC.1
MGANASRPRVCARPHSRTICAGSRVPVKRSLLQLRNSAIQRQGELASVYPLSSAVVANSSDNTLARANGCGTPHFVSAWWLPCFALRQSAFHEEFLRVQEHGVLAPSARYMLQARGGGGGD